MKTALELYFAAGGDSSEYSVFNLVDGEYTHIVADQDGSVWAMRCDNEPCLFLWSDGSGGEWFTGNSLWNITPGNMIQIGSLDELKMSQLPDWSELKFPIDDEFRNFPA